MLEFLFDLPLVIIGREYLKATLQFLRTTLVGGILFLVPIIVLVVILGKALAIARKLVVPLAEHIPIESVIGLRTPALLAIGVIVVFCFLAALLARTAAAKKLVNRLEAAVLGSVPGYEFLKSMGESMLGVEQNGAYPVVLVRFDDSWQIGFRTEVLENALVVVFLPGAPNPQSGTVCLLSPDRVTLVNLPAAATMKCLKRLGAGSNALVRGLSLGATLAK